MVSFETVGRIVDVMSYVAIVGCAIVLWLVLDGLRSSCESCDDSSRD